MVSANAVGRSSLGVIVEQQGDGGSGKPIMVAAVRLLFYALVSLKIATLIAGMMGTGRILELLPESIDADNAEITLIELAGRV
jgi:hypothetical protein